MKQNILYIILSLLFATRALAGSTLDIRQVEALPQSEINDIFEDSQGFVWIATLDGLFRYDGCNYISYRNEENENSLSSNMVLSVAEDSGGNIWIGTYGRGLCRLNPRTDEITRYSLKKLLGKSGYANDIVTIVIDKSDNIWIGNVRGVVKLKLNKETFDVDEARSYPLTIEEELDYDYINKIHIDRRDQIWIGSNNHLKRIIEVKDDELVCELFNVSCNDICDYDDKSIVASLGNVTLLEYDSESKKYTHKVLVDKVSAMHVICNDTTSVSFGGRYGWYNLTRNSREDWHVTQLFNRHNLPFSLPTSVVSSLEIVGGDQLWVGTRGGGIVTVNEKFKLFNSYPNSPQHQMPQTIIKSIMEDRRGNVWFGTEEDGVYIQNRGDRYGHNMKHLTVNPIDDRAYGFAQSGGVKDSLGRMSRDIVWVGMPYPYYLRAFDAKTYEPISIKYNTSHIGFVFTLCMSDENTLWAGTYNNGLWRFKLNHKGEIIKAKRFVTPNSTISSNIIRSLYLADDGALWIGTDIGINRIDSFDLQSTTPIFRRSLSHKSEKTLNDHYILQITQNSCGEMVMGSMGSGLIIYNRESDDLRFITTQDGLVNNSVKSIVEDPKNGDLWLSTNKGITCYSPYSGKIVNFGCHDGIDETEFSEIAGIRRSNGEIVFGNRLGFVSFTPQDIPFEESMPKLTFTDLFVNYQKVEVASESDILEEKLEYTEEIELEYEDRNFAIGFVGVDYHSSWGNHYCYKLEGLDDEWREISSSDADDNTMLAQYTNVPNGDYTFHVRVADRNNTLSNKEIKLDICVLPPWYRSVFAYFIYVLLVISIIYIVYKVARVITRRRHEVYVAKMEQRKVEDMMQYKLEFFMNISHEFRTPLTLLNIPLENLRNKSKNFDVEKYFAEDISEMKYNVGVLTNLINQLLDFRKIERGKEIVQFESIDVVSLLATYIEHFMPLAKRNGLTLTFEHDEDQAIINIDRRHFEKVVTNILSNAFKFTPSQGSVVVSVCVDSLRDVVLVKVKDSGSGISQEELPHIFERFYSSHNQSVSGTGIGLALCKGLVEMMAGRIWMESELGVGSCCIVEFPYSHKIVENRNDKILDVESLPIEIDNSNEENKPEKQAEDAKSLKNRLTILIVDDNKPLLSQLSRGLKDEYRVILAENGAEGLEQCRECQPDLIITDVVMPVMNGIEMCHAIKNDDTVSHTPILILSSDTSTRSKIESFDQGGVDGYLDKPFSMEVLRSNITTILHNRDILKSRINRESIVAPESVAHTPADIKYIKKIIAIIKENMSNPDLSVEFIATQAGVSRAYLSRKIKEITGETGAQFVRNIRLRYAAKLIEGKNMNISEVAWSVGYADVNSFRSRFKEMYGVSPTHYNGENSIANSEVDDLIK